MGAGVNGANPYEPPPAEVAPAKPHDPLAFPAIGFSVCGVLALILGSSIFAAACFILWRFRDIPDSQDTAAAYRQFGTATWIVTLSLLNFLCSYCLVKRKWRWYVIGFSLFTFLPLTGFLMVPLGLLTLVRLRQKQVWNSFQTGSGPGNA
jgi:hypothetical protein